MEDNISEFLKNTNQIIKENSAKALYYHELAKQALEEEKNEEKAKQLLRFKMLYQNAAKRTKKMQQTAVASQQKTAQLKENFEKLSYEQKEAFVHRLSEANNEKQFTPNKQQGRQ